MTAYRSDDEWTHDLASEDAALRDEAICDLRDMLCRGLSKSLSKGGRVDDAFLEDIVQEASMKILGKLGTFATCPTTRSFERRPLSRCFVRRVFFRKESGWSASKV